MPRLPDDMQQIVDHLVRGVPLIGPVRVPKLPTTHQRVRPWGFADGRRVSKVSIDALARRGLIRIHEERDTHCAVLRSPQE